jgi:hypothetical protein
MSTIQDLIAGLATAAFIWIAAFKAMSGTKADGFINPIKGAVEGFGKSLAKLPLYVPILPVDGGKKGSVGLAALTSGLSAPDQFIQAEKNKFSDIFGDKTTKSRNSLQNAKTESDAAKAIAQAYQSGQTKDKDIQGDIAKLLTDHKFVGLQLPKGYTDRAKFVEDLKKGDKVDQATFQDFISKNQSLGFVAPALDTAKALREGQAALEKAGKGKPTGMVQLDQASSKLKEKLNELDADKSSGDISKIARGVDEVTQATDQVKKLTTAFNEVKGIDPVNIIDQSGKVTNSGVAKSAKDLFNKVAPTEKEAAKETLIEKFAQHLVGKDNPITQDSRDKATTIVTDILDNGSKATGTIPPIPPSYQRQIF